MVRSGDDEEDAAYPSHTLAGMQAASTWDPVATLRCCCFNQEGRMRTCRDKGDGTTTTTTSRHGDDEEDVASPRHTFVGT